MVELGRAFVAGATGYTGRSVVRELVSRGIRAVAHIRPESKQREHYRGEFDEIGASVSLASWDASAIQAAVETVRPSLVFALLGTTRSRAKQEGIAGEGDIYQQVDARLTRILLEACLNHTPGARFVYLSSVGVNAGTSSAYLRARYETERAIITSGIPYTIARPSFISGPDRDEQRVGERVGAQVSDGVLSLMAKLGAGTLRDRYASMTGSELGRALVSAALDPGCAGRVLEADELRRLANSRKRVADSSE